MGCDIHSFCEVFDPATGEWHDAGAVFPPDAWEQEHAARAGKPARNHSEPFTNRNYSVFAFLAGVRNYAHCEPIAEQRGVPQDWLASNTPIGSEMDVYGFGSPENNFYEWQDGYHSHSWLLLSELLAFDYSKVFWNRRITRQESPNFFNGAALANEGEGTHETYRDFLGENFFKDLETMKTLGPPEYVRVVFYFDN
jgi:hypothetical protein